MVGKKWEMGSAEMGKMFSWGKIGGQLGNFHEGEGRRCLTVEKTKEKRDKMGNIIIIRVKTRGFDRDGK